MRLNKIKILSVVTIVIFLFSMHIAFTEDTSKSIQAVKQIVEDFCKAEFEGDVLDRRSQVVKLSQKEVHSRKRQRPEMQPLAYDKTWDELYVVTSYLVLESSITIKNNKAVAFVDYRSVAYRNKPGYKVVPDKKEHDIAMLNLIFDNNRWWVLDPPLPRIGKKAMIEEFENELAATTPRWFKNAGDIQRKNRDKKIETLRILKTKVGD